MIINIIMNGCEFDISPDLYKKLHKEFYRLRPAFGTESKGNNFIHVLFYTIFIIVFVVCVYIYNKFDKNKFSKVISFIVGSAALIGFGIYIAINRLYEAEIENNELVFYLKGDMYLDDTYSGDLKNWGDIRNEYFSWFSVTLVISFLITIGFSYISKQRDDTSDYNYLNIEGLKLEEDEFQWKYMVYVFGGLTIIGLVILFSTLIVESIVIGGPMNESSISDFDFNYLFHLLNDNGKGEITFYIRGLDDQSAEYSYHRDGDGILVSDHRAKILKDLYELTDTDLKEFDFNKTNLEITTTNKAFIAKMIPKYDKAEIVYQPNGQKSYKISTSGGVYTSIWENPVYKDGKTLNTPHEVVYKLLEQEVGADVAKDIIKAFRYTIIDKVHYLTLTNNSNVLATSYETLNKEYNKTITQNLYTLTIDTSTGVSNYESFKNIKMYVVDPSGISISGVSNANNTLAYNPLTTGTTLDIGTYTISNTSSTTSINKILTATTGPDQLKLSDIKILSIMYDSENIDKSNNTASFYYAISESEIMEKLLDPNNTSHLIIKLPTGTPADIITLLSLTTNNTIKNSITIKKYDGTTPIDNDRIEIIDFDIP